MARYRLTPQARTGFRNILEYVERDFGVRVAVRVLDKIEAAFELLAESPGIGHSREDLTADDRIQFWTVGPTLIAYRPGIEVVEILIVEILIVERGERDWERLMETDL